MPKGVYIRTKELNESRLAKWLPQVLGREPWNKGKKGVQKVSYETRAKLSKARKGNQNAKGAVRSEEFRKRVSEALRGDRSPNWRGGISREKPTGLEYRAWRMAVFTRDEFTCQDCGDDSGGNLEAHHIKSWAFYPQHRYDIDNGQTLCKTCHAKTDNYKGRNKGRVSVY